MSNVLPKLQPIIKSGVSERTLKVEVTLPERQERFRAVTQIGTKEILEWLAATKTPHGKLLSGPGVVNNRASGVEVVWVFEKVDLRVSHKPSSNKTKQTKKTKSS